MKALVGSWDHRPYQLLAEITALRGRIAQLERELAEARSDNAELSALVGRLEDLDGLEVAVPTA
jgi:hypothetical protein